MTIVLFSCMATGLHAYSPVSKPQPVKTDELLYEWNKTEGQYMQVNALADGSYASAIHEFCEFLRVYQEDYKSEIYLKYFMGTERKLQKLITDADVLYAYSLTMNEYGIANARIRVVGDIADWENLQVAAINWTNESYLKIIVLLSLIFFIFIIAVIWYASLLEKSKVREKESSDLNAQILQAQEAERSRLARELHDTVAQDMKYSAILAGKITSTKLSKEIRDNQDKCIEELRSICYNLSPPDLDVCDLQSALQMLCASIKKSSGLEVRLSIFEGTDFSFLSKERLLNIYRMVQETLNNIVHHAKATEVTVLFRNSNDKQSLALFITDDGCGMEENLVQQLNALSGKITTTDGSEHFGVRGMKERIRLLQGTLVYNSLPGEGTEVLITVPHIIK